MKNGNNPTNPNKSIRSKHIGAVFKRTPIIILLLFFFSFSKENQSKWLPIENAHFSFQVPKGFKKVPSQGVDSFVEEFQSREITISFDYGMYSNDFSGAPASTKFDTVQIDEKVAIMGWFKQEPVKFKSFQHKKYVAQVYFPKTSNVNDGNKLSMVAECESTIDINTAKAIFKTIKFK